jgi:hypothetical protein
MKTKLLVLAASLLLSSQSALAADSPLHGIWRVHVDSLQASRTHAFTIQDGRYTCLSCSPTFSIPADGAFHPVPAGPTRDELAVLVIDGRQVQVTERKDGRLIANSIYRVTGDGAMARAEHQDHSGRQPVVSMYGYAREQGAANGAHPVSGTWVASSFDDISNSGRLLTLTVNGNRLHLSSPQGHEFTVPMDGSMAPVEGSSLVTGVSVRKIAPYRVEATLYNGNQVVGITTYHVLPSGHTMKVSHENRADGSMIRYVANRQVDGAFNRSVFGVGDREWSEIVKR